MLNIADLRATQAIIHTKNLRQNYRNIKASLGADVRICAVVKANAYGHGLEGVAAILESEGADAFGVACLLEGYLLRRAGCQRPIHLLGLCLPQEMSYVVEYNLIPLVCSIDELISWESVAKTMKRRLDIQIGVDTGMGRIGCKISDIPTLLAYVKSSADLRLVGVMSHFARADEVNHGATDRQIQNFEDAIDEIKQEEALFHLANSAAILSYKNTHHDMVRPGLLMYGYNPLPADGAPFDFLPVMEFVTHVLFMKKVPAGTPISYGGQYVTQRETWIATLPVGYADGYHRLLTGKARVLIHNKFYPAVGKICMDQMMVDLGPETQVQLYDKVVLFGDEKRQLTAAHIAQDTNTISYEVLTSIAARVPRIFKD